MIVPGGSSSSSIGFRNGDVSRKRGGVEPRVYFGSSGSLSRRRTGCSVDWEGGVRGFEGSWITPLEVYFGFVSEGDSAGACDGSGIFIVEVSSSIASGSSLRVSAGGFGGSAVSPPFGSSMKNFVVNCSSDVGDIIRGGVKEVGEPMSWKCLCFI